jgi:hypothetical protein
MVSCATRNRQSATSGDRLSASSAAVTGDREWMEPLEVGAVPAQRRHEALVAEHARMQLV